MKGIDYIIEKERFGNHVRKLREKIKSTDYKDRSISLQELSDKSNAITKKTLGAIERGQANPTFETILILAEILNVSLKELFNYRSNDPE